MTAEFRAHRGKTIGLFALMAVGAAGFAAFAAIGWENALVSGALILGAMICGGVAGVFAYRIIQRPVLIRIDEDGIFLRRLDANIPWAALDRVERFSYKKNTLFELVEREGGHPIFSKPSIAMGASANALIGLPPLCESIVGMDAGPDEFAAAVEDVGRTPLKDRTPAEAS